MRIAGLASLFAVVALTGCGGGAAEDQADDGEGIDVASVAAEMEGGVRPTPGEYRSTVEILDVSIPGMSGAQAEQMRAMMGGGGPTSQSFCLTPEEAEAGPEQMVEQMAQSDCTFDSFDRSGNSFSAEMRCSGAGGVEGAYTLSGEMTAESSTMTMRIDQSIPGAPGGGRMEMEMRVTSQRIGDCA